MSESLHPNYLLTFDGPISAYNEGTFGPGYVYHINFFPSGLILFVYAYTTTYGVSYRPSDNSLVGVTQYQNIYWASPVPKTYEFLKEDGTILWQIKESDWQEPSGSDPFYTCNCTLQQHGSAEFFLGVNGSFYTSSTSKLLFIDSMLWEYRDSKTVAGQTEEEIELYPIYKREGTTEYLLNHRNLVGQYNFLTSYGALYKYDGINKLKGQYITTKTSEGQEDIGDNSWKTIQLNDHHAVRIVDGEIHYKYGSICNKAIAYDKGSTSEDTAFQDSKRALLTTYNENESGYCLVQNAYTSTPPFLCWLDEYYLWIKNDRIYRIPKDYEVAILECIPTSVSTPSTIPCSTFNERPQYSIADFAQPPQFFLCTYVDTVYTLFFRTDIGYWPVGGNKQVSAYGPSSRTWNLTIKYNFITQIIKRDNTKQTISDNSWWEESNWQSSYIYNFKLSGSHNQTGRWLSIPDTQGGSTEGTKTNDTFMLIFNFTASNFKVPAYNKLDTLQKVSYINTAYNNADTTYNSEWEYGWANRVAKNTTYLKVINYYYKKNSPTYTWLDLELKTTGKLLPSFNFPLINGSTMATFKDDNGNNVSQQVNVAHNMWGKTTAASASISHGTTWTTYYICVRKHTESDT